MEYTDESLVFAGLLHTRHIHLTETISAWSSCRIVFVDLIGFSRLEATYGRDTAEQALQVLYGLLQAHVMRWKLRGVCAEIVHVWDDGFAILLDGSSLGQRFDHVLYASVTEVERLLTDAFLCRIREPIRIRFGTSLLECKNILERFELALYKKIVEAGRRARRATALPPIERTQKFFEIMQYGLVTARYQPIVRLQDEVYVGWEGLSRGPEYSELHRPDILFTCAEQLGYLFELEKLCRTRVIEHVRLDEGQKLFLNIHPNTFLDPSFRSGETLQLLRAAGLFPEQIVFEVTEHQAVRDYALFHQLVAHYRAQGYKIAIDDTGSGHSGLVTLVEMRPDYVKIDMNLIRGIDRNETKYRIVRAIQDVSASFDATVIAEGIETKEELHAVREAGVAWGQGYYFSPPQPIERHVVSHVIAPA